MNKKIDFRVSETTLNALKQRAESENKTVSQVVRQIIESGLNLSDKGQKINNCPTNKTKVKNVATKKETPNTKGLTFAQILQQKRTQKRA